MITLGQRETDNVNQLIIIRKYSSHLRFLIDCYFGTWSLWIYSDHILFFHLTINCFRQKHNDIALLCNQTFTVNGFNKFKVDKLKNKNRFKGAILYFHLHNVSENNENFHSNEWTIFYLLYLRSSEANLDWWSSRTSSSKANSLLGWIIS